jgi:hypothetical protein
MRSHSVHLDEEHVQRLLHHELPALLENAARAHVAECADCRRRLAEAEREEMEVHGLLRAVDRSPASIHAEDVIRRAGVKSSAARRRGASRFRRVAGVLVAVGFAGAAYAVPGSPVRAWVDGVVQRMGGRPSNVSSSRDKSMGSSSGIAVLPGQRLSILIKSNQADGSARVSLTGAAEVQVLAPAGAATFTSRAEELLVDNMGSPSTFEIRIPRSAPWVEIRVAGHRVFLKEGQNVTASASTSALGGYVLPLGPSRP